MPKVGDVIDLIESIAKPAYAALPAETETRKLKTCLLLLT